MVGIRVLNFSNGYLEHRLVLLNAAKRAFRRIRLFISTTKLSVQRMLMNKNKNKLEAIDYVVTFIYYMVVLQMRNKTDWEKYVYT